MAFADTSSSTGSQTGSTLDQLVQRHPMPTWRLFAWPMMIFMAVMMVWAYFAELEEFAVVNGEVIPLGKVKTIQHLEGGIIEDIFIKEGDFVKEGDPLLQLDLGSGGTNVEELQVRLDGEMLTYARLISEASGMPLDFPEDVSKRRPNMVKSQRQTFEARLSELKSSINILDEQVIQKEQEVKELEAQRKAISKNLKLARERFTMSESLLSEGLTARMEHLELEAELESLEGELNSIDPSIPRALARVAEAKERIAEAENKFRREAKEELGDAEQQIARISELLDQALQQGVRTEIKSPIDGVVKNLIYNTIGGVIRSGDTIMEIVPTGDLLVIEARLNPTDRGYVEIGQEALVKISTYDYARYGGLVGHVVSVAPDTSVDDNGEPFFRVIVETDQSYLGNNANELPITPGMQASIDIETGTRSVLEYMIKPVLKLKHESFRER
jgi:membrane fusion protein, adhesin transport system